MSDTPIFDQLFIGAELQARTRAAGQSNAVPLAPAEHRQLIGRLARSLGPFAARPLFQSARQMHQAAEQAAQADHDARPDQG